MDVDTAMKNGLIMKQCEQALYGVFPYTVNVSYILRTRCNDNVICLKATKQRQLEIESN